MKRKVNLVGQNTLTVSLPSNWAKKYNLKKGDEINLNVNQNQIVVSVGDEPKKELKEISIHLALAKDIAVRSILGAYYRNGYDIIRITYDDEEIFGMVKWAAINLIGFEITDRKPGSCVLKSYLMETKEEFNDTLSRMINTIKTVQYIFREDYLKGNYSRLDELEDYRLSCWKLRDLSMRIIVKKNLYDENNSAYTILMWSLEKINRNYVKMYKIIKENKLKKTENVLKIYNEVTELFDYFCKSIASKNIEDVEYIHKQHDKLVEESLSILPNSRKNSLLMVYIIENICRLQDVAALLIMIH